MAKTIPLIRAAVLFPMIRWLKASGHSEQEWMDRVGLSSLTEDARERPVPLLKVFDLFRQLAAQEGPDACAQLISQHSLEDLGVLGALILGARTPREALTRTVHVLPRYSTHEIIALKAIPGGLRLEAGWSLHLNQEIAHLTQQFTAALIYALCHATGLPLAAPKRMNIRPHPISGIDHLRKMFGDDVASSGESVLSMELDDRILDAPLPFMAARGFDLPPSGWVMPHGKESFSASVRLTLEALCSEPMPSLGQVAELAGMSTRSLQRLLTNEGTSFRALLDESRRARTIEALQTGRKTVHRTPGDFGFSGQSALSRAVRRWTGTSPKHLRRMELSSAAAAHDNEV